MLAEAADELPNHLEMAVFQRPYDGQGSGRGAGRKFFKALLIALILAGIGLGTMCYLDETIRAKTIGYWEQARKWVASLANNVRPVSHSKPAVAIEPIADRSTAVDRPGASELPPASRLLEAGNEAQRKGNWAQAIRQWEQLKSSGVKDEELPLGLDARIVAAKKKLQETGK